MVGVLVYLGPLSPLPVDTGVMVGVLVYLGPLSPALLPDDHPLVVRARSQDIPEPEVRKWHL